MASREEWCADKLSKLLQEDLRISTLNEIKDHLVSIPHEEASLTANVLDLPLVFDCLNDSNTEQVDLACEVLSLCMNNLNIGESTSRYGVPLERALNHPSPTVKLMALNEIERNIAKEDILADLSKRAALLSSIIRCIGDEDLAVAKKAGDIITKVGTTVPGINAVTASDVLEVLHEVMSKSEVMRLRVYEVIVNISKDSKVSFEVLRSVGLVSQFLEELNNNDILLRMNVVELLTQLGLSRHGYDFLDYNGVLEKLFAFIDDNDDPISLQLCEPGILRFFGHMANKKPIELLSKYPKLYDRLFTNIESSDLIIVGVTLDTIGHIAITNEGKFALDTTGNRMTYTIKTIVKLLTSLPTEVRIRALNCIENLLRVVELRVEAFSITRKWYQLLGDNPMELILKYAKNPFAELRLAGFGILNALAGQIWGQEEIKSTPGLLEFLLDRNVETVKECKEAKFEIVKLLSESTVFEHATSTRLMAFVKEGPFYVQAVTEVAVEGNE